MISCISASQEEQHGSNFSFIASFSDEFFGEVKISVSGQKPWTIVHGFNFRSPKKVLRKVCHSIVNEKRNLMALV